MNIFNLKLKNVLTTILFLHTYPPPLIFSKLGTWLQKRIRIFMSRTYIMRCPSAYAFEFVRLGWVEIICQGYGGLYPPNLYPLFDMKGISVIKSDRFNKQQSPWRQIKGSEMERETRFELATSTLARWCSTSWATLA